MKAFKKLALVTAIAAAPFAQAEMVAIDDALMGEMTGQAGITIELSTEVKIGDIIYTDTDGLGVNGPGSLSITGVRLGGSGGVGTALDGIKIDIDVDDTDGLIIHLGAKDMAGVLKGDNPVDFGLDVASVSLNGGANLVSGVNIVGNLGPIDVKIANSGDIDVAAYFEVTGGSLDVDVLGLGITNLTVGQDSSPILSDLAYQADILNFQNYYEDQVSTIATTQATIDAAAAAPAALAAAQTAGAAAAGWTEDVGTPDAGNGDATNTAGETQAELSLAASDASDLATSTGTAAATIQLNNAGSAVVRANGVQGVSNMAYVGMTVTTGAAGYGKLNGDGTVGNEWSADTIAVTSALLVTIDAMSMDIGMDLTMGTATNLTDSSSVSTSLGNVVINDLDLSGTTLAIYGH